MEEFLLKKMYNTARSNKFPSKLSNYPVFLRKKKLKISGMKMSAQYLSFIILDFLANLLL